MTLMLFSHLIFSMDWPSKMSSQTQFESQSPALIRNEAKQEAEIHGSYNKRTIALILGGLMLHAAFACAMIVQQISLINIEKEMRIKNTGLLLQEKRLEAQGREIESIHNLLAHRALSSHKTYDDMQLFQSRDLKDGLEWMTNVKKQIDQEIEKMDAQNIEAYDFDQLLPQSNLSPIDEQDRERPRLVVHIGPMKTGTTTIQTFSAQDRGFLHGDGWICFSEPSQIANTHALKTRCPDSGDHVKPSLCEVFDQEKWELLESFLQNHITKDTFVVDQMFGAMQDIPSNWERVKKAFEPFDVTIVVTYRRYFEWFVSFYQQAHIYGNIEEEITEAWPNSEDQKKRYNNRIPTIAEYHELLKHDETSIFARRWGHKHGEMHPSQSQYKRFHNHFPQIEYFIYHSFDEEEENSNIVGRFYCEMLNATNSCETRNRIGLPSQVHKYNLLNADMLAVAAYDKGLLDTSWEGNTRREVVQAIQRQKENRFVKAASDFRLICMTDGQMRELRQMSLDFEKEIFPEWTELQTKEHEDLFQKYAEAKRFCSIDVDKTLKMESWSDFFKGLRVKSYERDGRRRYHTRNQHVDIPSLTTEKLIKSNDDLAILRDRKLKLDDVKKFYDKQMEEAMREFNGII